MIARYLGEAQDMIEQVLMYPIGEKWFVDEQHKHSRRFFTQWSKVRALGVRAVSNIALSVALNHTSDPATIPATATSVTDMDEIHFYQAGTDVEIYPSEIEISGGSLTASFPRARLVKEDSQENPETGWPYADTGPSGPFIQEIDIKRVYTDSSDVGEFVWPLGFSNCPECGEDTKPACGYIRSSNSGVITLLPDTSESCMYYGASEIRINYSAGKTIDSVAEDAILHLAHALMPIEPCPGCDPIRTLWTQDRSVPEELTVDRADSLFGVQEGAWRAWIYATKNKHFRTTWL